MISSRGLQQNYQQRKILAEIKLLYLSFSPFDAYVAQHRRKLDIVITAKVPRKMQLYYANPDRFW